MCSMPTPPPTPTDPSPSLSVSVLVTAASPEDDNNVFAQQTPLAPSVEWQQSGRAQPQMMMMIHADVNHLQ